MKKQFTQIMAFILALTLCFGMMPMTAHASETDVVLESITIVYEPYQYEYYIDETFNPEGLEVAANYSDGSSAVITDYTLEEPDLSTEGLKEVVVTYQGKTASFYVMVLAPAVVPIAISMKLTPPTKTVYKQGEALDLSGMEATITYDNGTTTVVPKDQLITSVPNMQFVGKQTITVEYGKLYDTFEIEILPLLEKITVTPPTKTEYVKGEKFDTAGMIVTAHYSDKSTKVIDEGFEITTPDMNKVGTQTVTVTYQGKTYAFSITVSAPTPAVTLTGIEVHPPVKVTYEQGETFSTEGMIITAVYSDNSRETVTEYTVSVPDMNKLGKQTVTVTYQGFSKSFEITVTEKVVVAPKLTSIKVTPPTKTTYVKGEEFDTTGMIVTAIYDDGSTKVIEGKYSYTMDEPDMDRIGLQVVTITYEGKSDHFEITVVAEEIEPEIHYIVIEREPNKTVYYKGETFDPSGMVVSVFYKDGSFEEITNYDITGYDMNRLGKQVVTVTHRTHSDTFNIEVIEIPQVTLTQIVVTEPDKVVYTRGEKFNADGLVVTAHYSDGTYQLCTDFEMDVPDMNRVGQQQIKVRYGGFTDEFVITILLPEGLPFVDVSTKAWYYDEVHFCYHMGYMTGVSTSRFDPDGTTTRAMIATILYRLAGSPEEIVANPMPFSDVPDGKWFSDAITWCSGRGIVSGYGNNKFGPNDKITREQMAAMLYRYAKYAGLDTSERAGLKGFNDHANVSKWAVDPLSWCVAEGIICGTGNNNLSPTKGATRAEVATMLCRFYNLINNPCCNN